jgi:hypothetical protein
MLLSKKYNVREVGMEVGYSNLSNFAKASESRLTSCQATCWTDETDIFRSNILDPIFKLYAIRKTRFCRPSSLLAAGFKAKVSDHHFSVNPNYGKGYCWAEKLPSGITVIVSDTCLKERLTVERQEVDNHYFTLQFNEEAADETEVPTKSRRNNDDLNPL